MKTLILLSIIHFLGSAAFAETYRFDSSQGRVTFSAKGKPAFIAIKGTGAGVSGVLQRQGDSLAGELVFELSTLGTGIDLRDEHMKEKYLQIKTHPTARLKIEKLPPPSGKTKFAFTGRLSLHGAEHDVTGEGRLSETEGQPKFSAEFPLKLSWFQIDTPGFQGITVAEDVTVKIETTFTRNE